MLVGKFLFGLLFFANVDLCEEGLRSLPNSLEQISHSPQFYLKIIDNPKCTDKLTEALVNGALNSQSKREYACALFKIARSSDTYWAETFAEVILPDLFLGNPIDSIKCVDDKGNDFYLLSEGLFLRIKNNKFSQKQFASLMEELKAKPEFDKKELEKILKLNEIVIENIEEAKPLQKQKNSASN